MRLWNQLAREPWAITETAMQTILSVAARENESPEAVASKLGRELQNTYNATEREGVAILPVTGPLFRYANIFTSISGATSYELIAKDFRIALDNPQIKAIILDIDSPGGEVNGVSELSSMIYEARGKKPILAYASGDAASGAYWIASAADEIVVSETSALGSIGVVGMYRADDDNKTIEIVSSQSPHKRLDVSSDEGRLRLQTRIDSMADVFYSLNCSPPQYRSTKCIKRLWRWRCDDRPAGRLCWISRSYRITRQPHSRIIRNQSPSNRGAFSITTTINKGADPHDT